MKTEEKLKALIAILKGKPEVAQQILDDAVALEKAATDAGLSTKEVQEMFAAPAAPVETTPEEVIPTPAAPAAPIETKELSLDRKAQVARDAIYASLNPMGLEKASGTDNGWPIEIYETYAIINKQGKNYKVPYTIGAEGKASLGDAVEVEQDWKPVEKMLARFEAAEKAAPAAPAPDPEPVEIGDWTPEQLQKFILDCVKPMMSKKETEDAQVAEKAAKTEATLAEISASIKALNEASAALAKVSNENQQALRELTDARPAGLKQLQDRRPTEHADNVVAVTPTGPQIDPAFRNFSQGGK